MKYFILTMLLFVNNVFSETKAKYTVDITFITDAGKTDIMNFKNKLTYRNTRRTASWKDSAGNYGILKCLGNYLSSKTLGTSLNLYCQGADKDGDEFELIMKRNSEDYDGGIGKSEYVHGEGKFKKLINTKCIYAVEILNDFSILKQKCKTNN